MKIKHLIMVSLILAIFTIGAVSASEDVDDVTAMNDAEDTIVDSVENENIVSDSSDKGETVGADKEIEMEVTDVPKTIKYGEFISCNVTIKNDDACGTLSLYVDNDDNPSEYSVEGGFNEECGFLYSITRFGNHTLFVKYSGDSNYADKNMSFPFTVEDYDIEISNHNAEFGSDYDLFINLPNTEGKVIVTYKGVQYTAESKEETYDYIYVTIPAKELEYGLNNVTIRFIPASNSKFKEKTVEDAFNCTAMIHGPIDGKYDYGEVGEITLILPNNAKGNLTVKINDESKNITVVNGKASFSLNDLVCGRYSIEAKYSGDDYGIEDDSFEIEITPNVVIPEYVYSEDENYTIVITLPETTNATLVITKGDVEIYNNESAHGIITLTVETGESKIQLSYEDESYSFDGTYQVSVREVNPKFEMDIIFDEKLLKGNEFSVYINIPSEVEYGGISGEFILYVDGKKVYEISAEDYLYMSYGPVSLGKHTWTVEFAGDNYYSAENKSGSFEVGYIEFDIPENITFSYGDYNAIGQVDMPDDATGMITLFIDGKEHDSSFIEDGNGYIGLHDISMGKHDIEVRYSGNYPDCSYKCQVNADYKLRIWLYKNEYAYGEPVTVDVYLPIFSTGSVALSVAGKNYTAVAEHSYASFTLTDLAEGDYTAFVTYLGNSQFPSKTVNGTFKVSGYAIIMPESSQVKYGDDNYISLTLPSDANGTLFVKVDGNEYKNATLVNGKASVSLKDIAPGTYSIEASFEGNYTVETVTEDEFEVEIPVDYIDEVELNGNAWVYIILPGDVKGNITIDMGEFGKENITPKDGIVNFTLPSGKLGYYSFTLTYTGDDYDGIRFVEYWGDIIEYGVSVSLANFIFPDEDNMDNKISFTLPEDAKGKLSIYQFNGDTYKYDLLDEINVTGPKVSVPLDMLKPGNHDLKIVYEDEKYGNFTRELAYMTISKPVPQINISNSGNDKTAVFSFELPKNANGDLIVKIDGVSYHATVKNGMATLSVDNLASGNHNVSVLYSGDENYTYAEASKIVSVASSIPAKIVAKELSVIYSAGTKYTVTVYAEGGSLATGVTVVIKINGKKVATVKTNSKGVATYNVVQIPGTYKITAEALGKTVTKKLTVKHVLKLQKVKVKRSAKKLVIKVTLSKVNGKYLKSKKITLKFKGKRYTAKTSSKGVAKFTIKKNVLKKLKAGKKVTYQATYLKDTVKYTVKVKR
nr:Ig-like domain repeat protein [uncultured Methanobrevibacter sp.]